MNSFIHFLGVRPEDDQIDFDFILAPSAFPQLRKSEAELPISPTANQIHRPLHVQEDEVALRRKRSVNKNMCEKWVPG